MLSVIKNSFEIAEYEMNKDPNLSLSMDMLLTIAAYHDIGLSHGRKNHEKRSALMLLEDTTLLNWFNKIEIMTMAEAVEDHRASRDERPRDMYGLIISEADRDLSYEKILRRVVQYAIHNGEDEDNDIEGILVESVLNHVNDKYGVDGYINLWLSFDRNVKNLEIIRNKLSDRNAIVSDIARIYIEETDMDCLESNP